MDNDWYRQNEKIIEKASRKKIMAPRTKKPLLIAVGNHLIDPTDVACISKVKNGKLYVVNLKSQPNKEYPIWVKPNEITALLEHLNIVGDLGNDED